MAGRLFTLAAAVSLALCAAAAFVWLVSFCAFAPVGQYWTTSWDGNGSGWTGHGWIAVSGSVHLLREAHRVIPAPTSNPDYYAHSGIDPLPGVQPKPTHWGFAHIDRSATWRVPGSGRRISEKSAQLSFPGWLPPLVFATLPALWLRATVRRRRLRSAGLCTTCEYNLTGNTSGICPECGTPVVGAKA